MCDDLEVWFGEMFGVGFVVVGGCELFCEGCYCCDVCWCVLFDLDEEWWDCML